MLTAVVLGAAAPSHADPHLSESVFRTLLLEFQQAMTHRTEPLTHRPLTVTGLWEVEEESAYVGANFSIQITGGLARHPAISTDGLALILCHEVGHLAGVRRFRNPQEREFNADHFAASYCFPRLLASAPSFRALGAPDASEPDILRRCLDGELAAAGSDLDTCIRTHQAARGVSRWIFEHFARHEPTAYPDMQEPDLSRAARDRFDFAQCRLESFAAGAVSDPTGEMPACAGR